MQKKADNIQINRLPKAKIEIIGSIKAEDFLSYRKQALQNISDKITIDGFRKGKVPENILISRVGEMTILEEMAELAISKIYPEIIANEKIGAIGRPEVNITKLALNNPLEFKIVTSVLPEVKIGDYKKIAKEKMKAEYNKKLLAQEKRRIAFADAILESSSFEIPEILIDSETRRIEAQFIDDASRMGVKQEDYLKHAKRTIDDLRKEWRPHAEKKAKLQLILNNISELEKIVVDEKEIEDEAVHILAHYKDGSQVDKSQVYTYAETVLTNEKIFKFLEDQAR